MIFCFYLEKKLKGNMKVHIKFVLWIDICIEWFLLDSATFYVMKTYPGITTFGSEEGKSVNGSLFLCS